MSQNIFTSENIMKYKKSGVSDTTIGIGEWTVRNDEPAICMRPAPFYISSSAGYCHIFENEINPNTQYIIDLWMDTDDVINNGTYHNGGLIAIYNEGSQNIYTAHTNGWKHYHIITPVDKSLRYLRVQYNYNLSVYFRWDSCICPISTTSLNKNGQLFTTQIIENANEASIDNGGVVLSPSFIEY